MDEHRRKRMGWLRSGAPPEPPEPGSALDAMARLREMASPAGSGISSLPINIEERTMETTTAMPAMDSVPTESVLCGGTSIKVGEYKSDKDLSVYGHWEGKLEVASLFIGPGGSVTGEVKASVIRNHGVIEGHISAGTLVLYKGSQTSGEVRCNILGVQPESTLKAQVTAEKTQVIDDQKDQGSVASTGFESEFGSGGLRLVAR